MAPRDDAGEREEKGTGGEAGECQRCGRPTPGDAKRCPECDYRPRLEGAAVGVVILGVGLAISVLVSWFIGAPVVVLGLGMLCLSPFMTVTNSDVMPGSAAPTGRRPDD